MRNDAFRMPLTSATNSLKVSGLNSRRNQSRASRSTGSRRSSKSFRFKDALSNGVGILNGLNNNLRKSPGDVDAPATRFGADYEMMPPYDDWHLTISGTVRIIFEKSVYRNTGI